MLFIRIIGMGDMRLFIKRNSGAARRPIGGSPSPEFWHSHDFRFGRAGFPAHGQAVKLKGGCLHHDNGLLGAGRLYAGDTAASRS